ncbi:MAG: hypothetical protein DRO92_03535 [Candidatus Altiarchaeales archaeon]|nr:MAG: hypothetical protein DRO92_03535 [Candidatus Altiarchaeales archaeon]
MSKKLMKLLIIGDILKISAFFLILFILSALIGFYYYYSVNDNLMPLFKEIVRRVYQPESRLLTTVNIFINNLTVTMFAFIGGITIIVPILIVFINGFVFGFLIRYSIESTGLKLFIKGVLVHSIFELPAFFISAAIGFRIGITFALFLLDFLKENRLSKIETVIRCVKEGIAIFVFIVIPLLLIAAISEVYITGYLMGIY